MKDRFDNISTTDTGTFAGTDGGYAFGARYDLFLIQEAWTRGASFEDLADGFGRGLGTCGGDWSGIRDSSDTATAAMLQRALNYLFPLPRRVPA